MKTLDTSLLREKFVLHDPNTATKNKNKTVIALSNRMVITLKNNKTHTLETFIIRTQNMHSCVRMAARLVKSFNQGGAILKRASAFDWESEWNIIVNDYEYAYNHERWICIYHNGKIIFKSGEHHPFLDVIEKFAASDNGEYEDSIPLAEDAFKKTGKIVKIEYDGNVALAINLEEKQGRCGIILRGANRTTTFNFSANSFSDNSLNFSQCITAAAAFLEGIQLAFLIGINNVKIMLNIIKRHSKENKQNKDAIRRLTRLDLEISNFENVFEVRYRPEKPNFQLIIIDSEKLAMKILKPNENSGFIE
ncbi:MAG: hypothetical protein KAJ86_08420 [Alphaproteobacteria bacterium]|nr:hypothetical protein [Alphaproteobacteria bacterium]